MQKLRGIWNSCEHDFKVFFFFFFDTPEYIERYSGGCMYFYLDSKNVKHFQKEFCLFVCFLNEETVTYLTFPSVSHGLD